MSAAVELCAPAELWGECERCGTLERVEVPADDRAGRAPLAFCMRCPEPALLVRPTSGDCGWCAGRGCESCDMTGLRVCQGCGVPTRLGHDDDPTCIDCAEAAKVARRESDLAWLRSRGWCSDGA